MTADRPHPALTGARAQIVQSAPLRPRLLPQLASGLLRSAHLLNSFAPDALVALGGYPVFPVLCTAALFRQRLRCAPSIYLIEPNAVAGKVNEWFSRFAKKAFLQFEEAASTLACPTETTGLPVRSFVPSAPSPHHPLLLVLGGSQGAWSLVKKALHLAPHLPKNAQLLVIASKLYREAEALFRTHGAKGEVLRYLDNPLPTLSRANLVIARAGGSTLAELALTGTPPLLIPYPQADRNHQWANARALQRRTGCLALSDRANFSSFRVAVQHLLKESSLCASIAQRLRAFAPKNAAETVAQNILEK